MDLKVDTVSIGVTDTSSSLEFYERGFGFRVRERAPERISFELGRASTLELREWDRLASDVGVSPESSGFRGFTLSYIVADPSGVDDMLARLAAAGGEIVKEPRFAFWGYSGHVSDPSGHLWKIASPKRKRLLGGKRAVNGVPEPVAADELALTIGVGDMKRAKRFYKDELGNPTKKEYSKFVSFDGDGGPDLSMYKWDALADDADVPADGTGFRGFTMSHAVDSHGAVGRLLDTVTNAGGSVLTRAADTAYFADVDGYIWRVATR